MARYVLRQPNYDALLEFLQQHGREDLLAGALELTEISPPEQPDPPDFEDVDADGSDEYGRGLA